MFKKLIFTGLLATAAWITPVGYGFHNESTIPYESLIAQEFNRMRGTGKYSSVDDILNQNLRGKSVEQKSKIIADLKVLESAVHKAYLQAEHDGKGLWYYGYIWKDNNPSIQSLIQLEADITYKIKNSEVEIKTDIEKLIRYMTPFTAGVIAGITLLWLAQGNLSYDYYVQNKQHGLLEMFQAPTIEVLKASTLAIKGMLLGAGKVAEGVKYSADAGASML